MYLAIAAGFTSLMMDFHEGAIVCGFAAVALWTWGWVNGKHPSPLATVICGGGLVVTTIWWPKEFWWQAAITLLWIGVAIIVIGLGMELVHQLTRRTP